MTRKWVRTAAPALPDAGGFLVVLTSDCTDNFQAFGHAYSRTSAEQAARNNAAHRDRVDAMLAWFETSANGRIMARLEQIEQRMGVRADAEVREQIAAMKKAKAPKPEQAPIPAGEPRPARSPGACRPTSGGSSPNSASPDPAGSPNSAGANRTETRMPLTLSDLRAANIARQAEWCPDQVPDLLFRGNELAGETGEACNVIKKLERERQGWAGSRASADQLAEELADVVICADLCAVTAGIDLDAAVIAKFNATSERLLLTTRLPTAPMAETTDAPVPAPGEIEDLVDDYGAACVAFGMVDRGDDFDKGRQRTGSVRATLNAALAAREREVASVVQTAIRQLQAMDRTADVDSPEAHVEVLTRAVEAASSTLAAYLQTLSPETSAGEAREAKDPSRTDFIQGFAVAVASVARDHDEPTLAASVIVGSGLTKQDFDGAELDTFDLKPIRRLFRTEAQLRTPSTGV